MIAVNRNLGFFIQDTWSVSNRLTLNGGIRYEYQQLPQPGETEVNGIVLNNTGGTAGLNVTGNGDNTILGGMGTDTITTVNNGATVTGTVAGALFGYLLARRVAWSRVRSTFADHPKWEVVRRALVEANWLKTLWIVFLMRLSPVLPFGTTNVQAIISYLVGLGNLSALQGRCVPTTSDQLLSPLMDALRRAPRATAALVALFPNAAGAQEPKARGLIVGSVESAIEQPVDTSTAAGKAFFDMLGVFAEFERGIIAERVRAGLSRARAQGKPLGRPRVPSEVEQAIREHRAKGTGILKIAREMGIGVSVVQRVVRQAA